MEKLIVDEDICIGCGFCCASKPNVFDMNDEDRAYVLEEKDDINNIEDEEKDEIMDILEGCPVGAIKIESIEKENAN